MTAPQFVTDPLTRRALANMGYDPDDPRTLVEVILPRGIDPGRQPRTDLIGDLQAIGRGLGGSISNTIRGIGDLPLALGRALNLTESRIEPRNPTFVEQANPAAAGIGSLTGTLLQMVAGSALLGRAGALSRLSQAGRAAELGPLGLAAGRAATSQPGLFSGFQPAALLSRGTQAGASFGLIEALQPGDVSDRVGRAVEGATRGFVLGALGAPRGTPYLKATLRDSVAGLAAFGNEPVIEGLDAIPPFIQNIGFGAAASLFTARRKTKKQAVTSLLRKVRHEGGKVVVEDVPNVHEGREIFPLPGDETRIAEFDALLAELPDLPPEIRTNLYESGLVQWINESRSRQSKRKPPIQSSNPRVDLSNQIELIFNNPPKKTPYFDPPILNRPIGTYESLYGEAGRRFDEKLSFDRNTIRPILDPSDSTSARIGSSKPVILEARGKQFDPFTGKEINPTGLLFDPQQNEINAIKSQPARFSRRIYLPGENPPSKLSPKSASPSQILRVSSLPVKKIDDIDLDQFDASARRRLARIERAAKQGRSLSRAAVEAEESSLARREKILAERQPRKLRTKISNREFSKLVDPTENLRARQGQPPMKKLKVESDAELAVRRAIEKLSKICKDIT